MSHTIHQPLNILYLEKDVIWCVSPNVAHLTVPGALRRKNCVPEFNYSLRVNIGRFNILVPIQYQRQERCSTL